ncbi:MAG: hypothetical protein QG629_79 [Patescibacteria group bacterium]|nr:hypothetical protein [Candidatus Saccharibacteria bacterium]MDQ5962997.1 hypothetical protein [Patescibacteria group bacterium]
MYRAHTLQEAEEGIRKVKTGGLAIQAVLLDGNINPRSRLGEDVLRLATAIQQTPEEKRPYTVGFSIDSIDTYGIVIDVDMTKEHVYELPLILDTLSTQAIHERRFSGQ